MILDVRVTIDDKALSAKIESYPGGKETFIALLEELGRLSNKLDQTLMSEIKGASTEERREYLVEHPKIATELRELFLRLDQIREQINQVLKRTLVREQILNLTMPHILWEVSQPGTLVIGSLLTELSASELHLREAMEEIPK